MACNLHIGGSYLIEKRDFRPILESYRDANLYVELFENRSIWHMCLEWVTHNGLYMLGIQRDRTKDVDLDTPQTIWYKIGYFFGGILFWPFIK